MHILGFIYQLFLVKILIGWQVNDYKQMLILQITLICLV